MRILIIHTFYQDPGGEDSVFENEARLLMQEHVVRKLTFQNEKGLKGAMQTLLSIWNFRAQKRVKKEILEFGPDIIHLHNIHYASGPAILRTIKNLNIPMVMTVHNFRLLCPSAILYFNGKLFLNSLSEQFPWTAVKLGVLNHSSIKTFILAFNYWFHRKAGTWNLPDRYILLNNFARSLFEKSTFPVDAHKYVVKPNFVAPETHVRNQSSPKYFLYIGRLTPEKGIVNFLKATLDMQLPIQIIGDGPDRKIIEDLAAAHPSITYLGFKNHIEMMPVLANADALIVPSLWFEGMPMTILEAFSLGIPVLGSDLGGIKDLIIPYTNGLMFDPNRAENIRKTIVEWNALSDSEKDEIRKSTLANYFSKFTPEINLDRMEKIYQSVLK